jgi:hypothetical protein
MLLILVQTPSSKISNLRASVEARRRRQLKTAASVSAVAGGVAVLHLQYMILVKTPMVSNGTFEWASHLILR